MSLKDRLGLVLGPILFLLVVWLAPLSDLEATPRQVLGVALWMAVWWVLEVVPLAVTAILPIILFPLLGVMDLQSTTKPYSHPYIFLYLGGFFIAISIEKWNLHKRIALSIIALIGSSISYIILGFMVGTAFLSMWISNTAAAVMILPVGMAIVKYIKSTEASSEKSVEQIGKALMLGIAYAASIGGIATLIGTPPNLILASVVKDSYGIEISFAQWIAFGLPVSVVLLLIAWIYLTRVAFRFKDMTLSGGVSEIKMQLDALGRLQGNEKKVLAVFMLTALSWIFKDWLIKPWLPSINDTLIGLMGGALLFLLPGKEKGSRLVDWGDMYKIPWDIILLFGGGLSLAAGFESSGLAFWIGGKLQSLDTLHLFTLTLVIIASINLLTEFTSNLATTAMLLPVLVSVAAAVQMEPFVLLVGATVAASCAFMLPVATPPNAIVFGSGYLRIKDMVKNGFILNIVAVIIVLFAVYYFLPIVWGL